MFEQFLFQRVRGVRRVAKHDVGLGLDQIVLVLTADNGGFENLRQVYVNIAKSAGMSEAQFDACVQDEPSLKALNDRYEKEMKEFDVQSTPTFVVNGQKMNADHPPSLDELSAAIDPLLAK